MSGATVIHEGLATVIDYRCTATPHDRPFIEVHPGYSVAFVRSGSFGYRYRGRNHQLVAGSMLTGCIKHEFCCTHEHHAGGDECVACYFSEEQLDTLGVSSARFSRSCEGGYIPPLAASAILGAMATASLDQRDSLKLDQVAVAFAAHVERIHCATKSTRSRLTAQDSRRAIRTSIFIDEHCEQGIDLASLANMAHLSATHYLRVFARTLGVTPHQYLLQARLRRATKLLIDTDLSIASVALESGFQDVSNFVRCFGRVAGQSPRRFRLAHRSA